MARQATTSRPNYSGLYGWLLEREEAAARAPGGALAWTPERPGYDGIPERLAALRAGQPVTVFAGGLPSWALGSLGVPITAVTYVRASADGRVELADDGARLFAEENEL